MNAFRKARLYDDQLRSEERVLREEVDEAIFHLNGFEDDVSYLYDVGEEILFSCNLIFEDEVSF